MRGQNIIHLFVRDEPDGLYDRLILSRRGELVWMELLNELATVRLYGLSHRSKVPASHLYRHETVNQCDGIVEIRTEHRRHEEPRL